MAGWNGRWLALHLIGNVAGAAPEGILMVLSNYTLQWYFFRNWSGWRISVFNFPCFAFLNNVHCFVIFGSSTNICFFCQYFSFRLFAQNGHINTVPDMIHDGQWRISTAIAFICSQIPTKRNNTHKKIRFMKNQNRIFHGRIIFSCHQPN